jgi:hypothetical protein
MATAKPKVQFEPVPIRGASGRYVLIKLPNGQQPQLGNFRTETEAREWIEHESAAWLRKFEGGRYA